MARKFYSYKKRTPLRRKCTHGKLKNPKGPRLCKRKTGPKKKSR